jgi:hypothetical protein
MTRDRLVRGAWLCLFAAATLYTVERLVIWLAWGIAAAGFYMGPLPPGVTQRQYHPPDLGLAANNLFVWLFIVLAGILLFLGLRNTPSEPVENRPRQTPGEQGDQAANTRPR